MFSSKKPQRYKPLSQREDDSDDEVVLYAHNKTAARFGNGVYDRGLDLELPPTRPAKGKRHCSKLQAVCFILVFLVVLCVVLVLAVLLIVQGKQLLTLFGIGHTTPTIAPVTVVPSPLPSANPAQTEPGTPESTSPPQTDPGTLESTSPAQTEHSIPVTQSSVSWERTFEGFGTESSLQLVDLNGDGILDVVTIRSDMRCAASIVILDGQTGSTVWERELHFECFAVRCELDVTGDGRMDCVVCGRDGGFLMLDGRDGRQVWAVQPTDVVPFYNFYFPLIVRDLDGDGVRDLINVHGGDSTYTAADIDRSPGFLLVVSGRTGQQLMSAMLMPDGHETYMSPVLFSIDGSVEVVLFGSGGETVSGSLWAVTLDSIQEKVLQQKETATGYHNFLDTTLHMCDAKKDLDPLRPVFNQSLFQSDHAVHMECPVIAGLTAVPNRYQLCVYKLLSGEHKGMLVPPVVVDITNDGVDDLVVPVFEGHTRLLDGRDLSVVWNQFFALTESYSVPTPLYFNEDDTLDLLIRASIGAWPTYTSSDLMVLDGRNGEVLWDFPSSKPGMASPIVIAADTRGYDVMVFFNKLPVLPTTHTTVSDQRMRARRHGGNDKLLAPDYDEDASSLWQATEGDEFPDPVNDFDGFLNYCLEIMDMIHASVFVLDRHLATHSHPKPLHSYKPYFHVPDDFEPVSSGEPLGKRHSSSPDPERVKDAHMLRCAHLGVSDMIMGTPVVGDIDSDGRLELVYTVIWGSSKLNASKVPPKLLVKALTIEDAMKEVYGEDGGGLDFSRLLPASQQPWPRYMGATGDNIYRSQL